jgi:hypothetical protein
MEHSIFYYPYGSFQDRHAPLLKIAALYFDKLNILDPLKAVSGPAPGAVRSGARVEDYVSLLERENILTRIEPDEVVHKYEDLMKEAIRTDLRDPEFEELCELSDKQGWELALAKVPTGVRDDPQFQPREEAMQNLMGADYAQLDPQSQIYSEDEVDTPDGKMIDYRYASYPLALGESIMINHAIFAGMLEAKATPLTDDPFHSKVLNLKIQRAGAIEEVREILEDRARQQGVSAYVLGRIALRDMRLNLPILSPELPLETILEYREKHGDELKLARETLAELTESISKEPWSEGFEKDLEEDIIPKIQEQLEEASKARDSYLRSRGELIAFDGTRLGLTTAGSAISLALITAPLMPLAVVPAVLGLAGSAVGLMKLIRDLREGKRAATENGLHYLIELPKRQPESIGWRHY